MKRSRPAGLACLTTSLLASAPVFAATASETDQSFELLGDLTPALERIEGHFYGFVATIPLMIVAVLVAMASWWLSGRLASWSAPFERMTSNPLLRQVLQKTVRVGGLVLGIVLGLEVLDATALVGGVLGAAGVVGIAVGFAFRELLENYIASIMLSVRRPFEPEDHVTIGDKEGIVARLTTRSTILTTFDGNQLRIPNAQVFKSIITNYSRTPDRRFDVNIGVGFGTDLIHAQALGAEVLAGIDGVLDDPEPTVIINDLGDFAVSMTFRAWIDQRTHSLARVRGEAIRRLKGAFEADGIAMPGPSYEIHTRQDDARDSGAPERPIDRDKRERATDTSADRTIHHKARQERAGSEDLFGREGRAE